MSIALRALPLLIQLALLVFCLIEAVQTPSDEVRNLSKGWWILLILFFPIIGGIAWLVAGRPVRPRTTPQWRMGSGFPEPAPGLRAAPLGPDDDPQFLSEMKKVNSEQEETLKQWEENLRRREAEQRRRESETDD